MPFGLPVVSHVPALDLAALFQGPSPEVRAPGRSPRVGQHREGVREEGVGVVGRDGGQDLLGVIGTALGRDRVNLLGVVVHRHGADAGAGAERLERPVGVGVDLLEHAEVGVDAVGREDAPQPRVVDHAVGAAADLARVEVRPVAASSTTSDGLVRSSPRQLTNTRPSAWSAATPVGRPQPGVSHVAATSRVLVSTRSSLFVSCAASSRPPLPSASPPSAFRVGTFTLPTTSSDGAWRTTSSVPSAPAAVLTTTRRVTGS